MYESVIEYNTLHKHEMTEVWRLEFIRSYLRFVKRYGTISTTMHTDF